MSDAPRSGEVRPEEEVQRAFSETPYLATLATSVENGRMPLRNALAAACTIGKIGAVGIAIRQRSEAAQAISVPVIPINEDDQRLVDGLVAKATAGMKTRKLVPAEATPDDGQRGLYGKYRVERMNGSSGPGGKHEHCRYFVLDLRHDKHAGAALAAYAESCRDEYPQLAEDLGEELCVIEHEERLSRERETRLRSPGS